MSVSGTPSGCSASIRCGLVGRHGQEQLEILAVAQGVFQRRRAVGQLLGQPPGIVVRSARRPVWTTAPAAAFRGQPRQIDRQPVADVDAGVQLVALVQQQGLVDPRLEIEMPAEDAAAEGAGDDDPVAGPGAAAAEAARGR